MAIFYIGYGTMFLLLLVWIALSIFLWKLGPGKALKWMMAVCLGILIISVYFNVHIYKSFRKSAVYGMMRVVGDFDSAEGQLKEGNHTNAAIDVASASGGMYTIEKNQALPNKAESLLDQLGETLQVKIAPAVANNNQQAIDFVNKADQILDKAKSHPQYPLFLLVPQLNKILNKVPTGLK